MKTVRLYSIALLLSLVLTNCTKEDLSMCGIPVTGVKFSYTHNAEGVDKFVSDVSTVSLYVFNEQNVCVATFQDFEDQIGPDYVMSLEGLAPGKYNLVAWADGADSSTYQLAEELADGSLDDFMLHKTSFDKSRNIIHNNNSIVNIIPTDLFHGLSVDIEIGSDDQIVEIPLIKNTNHIRTWIRGLERAGEPIIPTEDIPKRYATKIVSANGRLAFDNSIVNTSKTLTYIPFITELLDRDLYSEGRILRMQKGIPVALIIEDRLTNEEVINLDLVELLISIPGNGIETNEDLDRYDTFDIKIDVSNIELEIVVNINGWTIVIRNGELG